MNKGYNEELHKKYDKMAKMYTKEILGTWLRDNTKENKESNFQDGFWDQEYLICNEIVKVESEMKYQGYCFCFNDVHIPFRKKKNISKIYFVISTCGKKAWCCDRKQLDLAKVIWKSTRYEETGHYFAIPFEKGILFTKEGNKWQRIK